MKRDFGVFYVAIKILLKNRGRVLLLKDDCGTHWDLPGGRIDNLEAATPFHNVLRREVKEELGPAVKYQIGRPLFQYYRYAQKRKMHIVVTVYEGKYLSGEIKFSSEHTDFVWINPKRYKFKRNEFEFPGEYTAFKKYLQS